MNLLYVAIGGAVGSTARYLLAGAINQARAPHAAAGTFAVNVLGCFTFGIILAISEHRGALSSSTRAFLLVGVLGGFTTFSSYAYETFVMLRDAQFLQAALNAGGHVFLGLLALSAGYPLVRFVVRAGQAGRDRDREGSRGILSRQPVDSRTEDVTRSALQAENGTPARRRPEFHAWRLLSTACRDRKPSAPAHQTSPAVSVEIFVAAIGAEQRTQPRARAPALLDALEWMCAM